MESLFVFPGSKLFTFAPFFFLYLFLVVLGSSFSEQGPLSNCGAWASHVVDSLVWSTGSRASVVVEQQAKLPQSMWVLVGPGIQLRSPALVDGFLTTAPPGKTSLFFKQIFSIEETYVWHCVQVFIPRQRCIFLQMILSEILLFPL